jgi:nitrate/nitrite transporter NarK
VNAAERQLIAAGQPPAVAVGPVPWLAFLSSLNIWALSLMYGCVGFAGNFITNLLPVYLSDDRKLSDEVTTQITALPLALGVISCVLGGVLSDQLTRRIGRRWGRILIPGVGLACAAAAVMSVPYVQSVWLLAFLFGAWFFCNDLMMGPAWASCGDVGGNYAGTVSGMMNMTGQFVGAAGMYFAGVMLKAGRAETMFFVFGCSYILAALCWMAIDVTRPITTSPASKSIGSVAPDE